MIDIDKIEEQCKSAMQNGYGHLPVIECGNAVKISELISLLRQSEKDAARYRWLIEHGDFGVGRWGRDWDLRFEGPAPEHAGKIDSFIDEDIKCIVE